MTEPTLPERPTNLPLPADPEPVPPVEVPTLPGRVEPVDPATPIER